MASGVRNQRQRRRDSAHQATGDPEQLEEERRLFYVALTRAKDWLYVMFPLTQAFPGRGGYAYAQLSRFLTDDVKRLFTCRSAMRGMDGGEYNAASSSPSRTIRRKIEGMWS